MTNNDKIIWELIKSLKADLPPIKMTITGDTPEGFSIGYAVDKYKPREGDNIANLGVIDSKDSYRVGDAVEIQADFFSPVKVGEKYGLFAHNPHIVKGLGTGKPDTVQEVVHKAIDRKILKADSETLEDIKKIGLINKSRDVKNSINKSIPIIKDDNNPKQIVYGVVYEPFDGVTVDLQGDYSLDTEIEKSAHKFMENYQNVSLMHKKIINETAKVVESYIAPVDFEMGGQTIKKGSWVMATHVIDKKLWKAVEAGEIDAYSIEGFSEQGQDLI